MKRIEIYYYHLTKYENLNLLHKSIHPISQRNYLIDYILSMGYNIQLRQTLDTLNIIIDKGNFKQS